MLRYLLPSILFIGSVFGQTTSQSDAPAPPAGTASAAEDWIKKGREQFKAGQYQEASLSFEEATRLDEKNIDAKLGLANACIKLWMTGKPQLAENNYFRARNTLLDILDQQPDNAKALSALSRISLQSFQRSTSTDLLDEARVWNLRLVAIDPNDVSAHYALGVIAWTRCLGPEAQSHNLSIVKPSDSDVPPEVKARLNYRAVCQGPVEEGIWHLNTALDLDKENDASMGYLGALYNMKASYQDSAEDAQRDRQSAGEWNAKAEAVRKSKAATSSSARPSQ